jgi:TolB protein
VIARLLTVALATVLAAGCSGGSGAPTLGTFVEPHRFAAEVALANPDVGIELVGGDGRSLGVVRLPASLAGGDNPAWSPDGRMLAFAADIDAPSSGPLLPPTDIYVAPAAGGRPRRVTTGRNAVYPTWSPDGRWIAYTVVSLVDERRSAAIWVVHPDGTGARQLTEAEAGVFDLAGPYNPRTGVIAFTRCTGPVMLRNGMEPDTCSVWTMNPDASHQRRLAAESEQPAWSADGRRIAFASARDHAARISIGQDESSWIRQLYVMNADGSAQRRLLATATSDEWPSWAPGGAVIAYQSTSRQTSATTVGVVNADGSCRRSLPAPAGEDRRAPAWRPGGVATALIC